MLPRRIAKSGLKTLALETGTAQLERRARFRLGYDTMQAALDKRAQGDAFTGRHLAGFTQK